MTPEQNPKNFPRNAIATIVVAIGTIISLIADIEAVSHLWFSKILLWLILLGSVSYLVYLIYANTIKLLAQKGVRSLESLKSLIGDFQKKYDKSNPSKSVDSEVINSIINARKLKKLQLMVVDLTHTENETLKIVIDKGDIHGIRPATIFTVRHKLRLTVIGECHCESIFQETTILSVKIGDNLPFAGDDLSMSDISVWVVEPGELEKEETRIDPDPINRFIADLLCSIEAEKDKLIK